MTVRDSLRIEPLIVGPKGEESMALSVEACLAIQDLLCRCATAMEAGDENDLPAVFTDAPVLGSRLGTEAR